MSIDRARHAIADVLRDRCLGTIFEPMAVADEVLGAMRSAGASISMRMVDNSVRDTRILDAFGNGYTYDEIAAAMNISRSVVAGVCFRHGVRRAA